MDITLTHIPREEVLRYLGCPGTEDPATLALVEGCSARLLAAARPKWTYRVFDLAVQTDGVRLDCGLLLPGRDLAAHLRGCSRAALLAATLSAPVDALLRRAQAEDLAAAVALDCCATAAVEAVCDLAEAEIRVRFPGCSFPFRFSPGYGDLPIELQDPILRLLDAPRRVGLCATDRHILTPRKSVTAVLGISDGEISPQKRGCASCTFRDRCKFQCKESI
ncbi:MAG: methionine synthase [Clostridiales bacterium]|uniref:Methionine synthase n=1 Tax=Intestinimonas massiliensis (ex Afouda et al. 2020) TaxID=1673721 RepID=A0ABS9M8I7_9FIRM|nr:methionine synthase [Intestinimonas massiliensis (ex Afouda et al. 2020)]MCG4526694.1 methionine synthase [Intestinimonas massiliensis (ex Afouda et al. 2020)]MCQ4806419.1 methionine synthase [Intestinimonas massiliensis (ex Afouda et al. 2020)]MDU1324766.1 methionine synthase [Clostridiales bacterium]